MTEQEIQDFINSSEARKTFQDTPCVAQERIAFDIAVRETIKRILKLDFCTCGNPSGKGEAQIVYEDIMYFCGDCGKQVKK